MERVNKLFDEVFNLIYKFNKSLYKIVHEKILLSYNIRFTLR